MATCKLVPLLLAGILLISSAALAASVSAPASPSGTIPTSNSPLGAVAPFVDLARVRAAWESAQAKQAPPRVTVRGIYLTAPSAANPVKFGQLLALVERTNLNAMVIDVKGDEGQITFPVSHPLSVEVGAVQPEVKDISAFMKILKEKRVYTIARIVTFKDGMVPPQRPELAVAHQAGGVWRDFNGMPWLNPYNSKAWDYVIEIAKAAALAGFDEIQFDYVRFPTDGNLSALRYPGKDNRTRERVIADFLAQARKELRPYRVWISADVFGLVTSTADDMGIGQRLEEISEAVDYLSPMLYPSHYEKGNLGLPNPNAMPYETVHRSMLDAKARWEKADQTRKVIMRPWLQDFSWGHPYGPNEVRAQIQATYDAGFSEWLLWNAANVYTEAALDPQR